MVGRDFGEKCLALHARRAHHSGHGQPHSGDSDASAHEASSGEIAVRSLAGH